jgi:hypothetical protein
MTYLFHRTDIPTEPEPASGPQSQSRANTGQKGGFPDVSQETAKYSLPTAKSIAATAAVGR